MTESEDRDRYIVPALERGLRLLRGFTHGAPAMSLGEIAKANELPRATAFRLIRTLEVLGYLRRIDGTKTYRLGPAVLSLGFEYLASVDLPEIAGPALEGLRDRTGASAHLAVRDRDEIVYLCRVASRLTLTSSIRIGPGWSHTDLRWGVCCLRISQWTSCHLSILAMGFDATPIRRQPTLRSCGKCLMTTRSAATC